MATMFIRSFFLLLLLSLTACIAEPEERVQADPPPESPLPDESTEEEETGLEQDEEESPGDELTGPPDGYDVTLYGLHVTPDPVTTHATFSVQFTAPVEAELSYLWHFAGVTIGTGQSVEWTHRGLPGTYELRVEAADQYGLTYTADTLLEISSPHPWPAYQRDAQQTGHSPFLGTTTGEVRWHVELLSYSTPLVAEGDVVYLLGATGAWDTEYGDFVTDQEGIGIVSPAGDFTWMEPVPALFRGVMALSADSVFYLAGLDGVLAFGMDGEKRWFWEAEPPAAGPVHLVVAPDGTVYAGPYGDDMVALHPDTGDVRWRFETVGYATWPVIAPDGTVLLASATDPMSAGYRLDAIHPDGSERWQKIMGVGEMSYASLAQPVVNRNRVYAADIGEGHFEPDSPVISVFTLDGDDVFTIPTVGNLSFGVDGAHILHVPGFIDVVAWDFSYQWGVYHGHLFQYQNPYGPLVSTAEGSVYFLSLDGDLLRVSEDPNPDPAEPEGGYVEWDLQLWEPGGSHWGGSRNLAIDSQGRLIVPPVDYPGSLSSEWGLFVVE